MKLVIAALVLLTAPALADEKSTVAAMDSMLHQSVEREAAARVRLMELQQEVNELQQACAAQTPKKSSGQLSEK